MFLLWLLLGVYLLYEEKGEPKVSMRLFFFRNRNRIDTGFIHEFQVNKITMNDNEDHDNTFPPGKIFQILGTFPKQQQRQKNDQRATIKCKNISKSESIPNSLAQRIIFDRCLSFSLSLSLLHYLYLFLSHWPLFWIILSPCADFSRLNIRHFFFSILWPSYNRFVRLFFFSHSLQFASFYENFCEWNGHLLWFHWDWKKERITLTLLCISNMLIVVWLTDACERTRHTFISSPRISNNN